MTETPLEDGSSIAWGAPVWSGTGVAIEGDSAVVTIGRDAEGHRDAPESRRDLHGRHQHPEGPRRRGGGEVDPTTGFPVTATWTDALGEEHGTELMINAIEPTPLGVDLPAGTVVTLTEGERPAFATVVWGSIAISGDGVVDAGDGTATVVVSPQQDAVTLVTVANGGELGTRLALAQQERGGRAAG